jgi:hypothetical protein
MKHLWLLLSVSIVFIVSGCVSSKKVEMAELKNGNIEFIQVNDSRWDGKNVPGGEQGKKCGGTDPHFPSLTFNLKELGNQFKSKIIKIEMRAYDLDWPEGSHGRWSYIFDPKADVFTSPKIPSETTTMPEGVKGISAHTAKRSCDPGYYLAPSSCLANRGHRYFTDIIFTLENGESIVTTFSQGVY